MPNKDGALTPEEVSAQVGGKPVADEWDQGEEIKAGWIKLNENESIKGTLIGKKYQKSNKPGYEDQWVFEIKIGLGVMNIGFGISKTFILNKLKNVVIGQIVMIKRFADVPSTKFKGKFASSYDVRIFGMDPEYNDETANEGADEPAFS